MYLSYRNTSHKTTIPATEVTENCQAEAVLGDRYKIQQTTLAQRSGMVSNLKYRGVDPIA